MHQKELENYHNKTTKGLFNDHVIDRRSVLLENASEKI